MTFLTERSAAYKRGYRDGYRLGRNYDNPYQELSPEWCEYETGYDDGLVHSNDDLRYHTGAL